MKRTNFCIRFELPLPESSAVTTVCCRTGFSVNGGDLGNRLNLILFLDFMNRSTKLLSEGIIAFSITFLFAGPTTLRANDSNSKPSRIFKFGKRQQNQVQEQAESKENVVNSPFVTRSRRVKCRR